MHRPRALPGEPAATCADRDRGRAPAHTLASMAADALPISFDARYGAGQKRALVLGGGGLYFIAWQVAYLTGLARAGIVLTDADRVVGTSAGSMIASVYTGGGIRRFARTVEWLSKTPGVTAKLAPAGSLAPSQERALALFRNADNADPATVQQIGRAAMAAASAPASSMRRTARMMILRRRWPAPSLQITAVDTYTAERIVIGSRAGVPVAAAAAASGSVPGLFAPQLIGDRFCMDGGVSGTGTHGDLVAGAAKVIVVSLSEAFRGSGQRPGGMTQAVGAYDRELDDLRAAGSDVLAVGPEAADINTLMDPRAVPDALGMGARQAAADVDRIRMFWR